MQPEQQTQQVVTAPEIASVGESKDSKESKPPKRGGKRPGAGRQVNLAKMVLKGFSREAIAEGAARADCGTAIARLLKSKREKTVLEALVFVRDTLIGRPAQNVQVSGGVLHAHPWRPLASLTDEEVALLDKLTRKLSAPVLDALPDGPQNQTESKPAIDVEVVVSEAR